MKHSKKVSPGQSENHIKEMSLIVLHTEWEVVVAGDKINESPTKYLTEFHSIPIVISYKIIVFTLLFFSVVAEDVLQHWIYFEEKCLY